MPRIPEETIERLKQEILLERLAEARGVKLTRHGADLIGLCPFHDDHEPSLVISPKKNLWHCLGACQTGGTVIGWVMKSEGVSFRHAVELLRGDVSSLAASPPVKLSTVRKLAAPVDRDADDAAMLEQVVSYYHETLKQSPEALAYLEKRGLTNPEIVSHFRLGFANRTLGLRLPAKNRKAGAEMRTRLEKLGIMRESGHEHFNGSLVIPVFDARGCVVEMYGRKITENLRPGTPLHLYLPGGHRGVWNEAALEASKEIILCESLIDALTFWCAGFRNVTASYGVQGFTDDHRETFRRHGVKRVWIAYDRDDAGETAAASLSEELMGAGIECFRVLFPKGMDANEYALKVGPPQKSLGVLLNAAGWIGKGAAKEESTPAPVAVLPLAAEVEVRGDEVLMSFGDRRYRVRGLRRNAGTEITKVNLLASRGDAFHADTLNLQLAQQRTTFAKQAAIELGVKDDVVRHDLGRVLLKCEELQDEELRKALEPKRVEVAMSEADKAAALELLRDPHLLERVVEDFARCGVVGEETNKKIAYLAAVSRLVDAPLAVIVQSSSAAGKSSLMDAVLALMPEEQKVEYSAMTGQSLYYMGETDLKNKILAIAEEEGAQRASYALKLLQSEGALSIASTGKDPATGRLVTQRYRVEGPVMIFLTTTAIEIDEELLNRCLVLTVDEEREQTRAIHRVQREAQTLEGLLAKRERQRIVSLHRNAQRLLKPVEVVNPEAHRLSFPDGLTRARRDHMKFLGLIRAVTLLHQHQRPVKTVECEGGPLEYIETTEDDVQVARKLIDEVMGRAVDDLPPQTRRLLLLVDEMVKSECARLDVARDNFRFSRRDVRVSTGWSDAQVKRHLHKLEELEYVIVHRGGRGQSFVYELFFHYDTNRDGSKGPVRRGMDGGDANHFGPINTGLRNGLAAESVNTLRVG